MTESDGSEIVPGAQGAVARALFAKLSQVIAADELSFGGGTVLASRWGHRESLDVDLFCRPEAYARLGREGRARIERLLKEIPGCDGDVTWCDDIATYTEIGGIEATVLPRPRAIEPAKRSMLRSTGLRLQGNEEILYAKIAHRMYEAGEITVRDAYDVAFARERDPRALARALGHIDERALALVAATVEQLPAVWSRDDEKPLLRPSRQWDDAALARKLAHALDGDGKERGRAERER